MDDSTLTEIHRAKKEKTSTPAEDSFLVDLFHRVVKEKISYAKIAQLEYCPKCYTCPRMKCKGGSNGSSNYHWIRDAHNSID